MALRQQLLRACSASKGNNQGRYPPWTQAQCTELCEDGLVVHVRRHGGKRRHAGCLGCGPGSLLLREGQR